jgi:GntR family transcriptional regulator
VWAENLGWCLLVLNKKDQKTLDTPAVAVYQYSMLLHVNPSSGVPTYLQIETQVKHYIAAGALVPGDALPSVRKLAADLRISTNTAARAYQDLERDGVLRTVQGGRTYVAENPVSFLKSERVRRLRPYARQIAVEGTQLRLDPHEIMELVQQELDALEEVNERVGDLDRKSR